MNIKLHKKTVSDLLWEVLRELMSLPEFKPFVLVGGTALSLQYGHRVSIDIDLFTGEDYDTVSFDGIEKLLQSHFKYVDGDFGGKAGMGKSYFIGNDKDNVVKLDLFYTEEFVFPLNVYNGVRLADVREIAAMKLEVIGQGGRKKDFWDLHELMQNFSWIEMLDFYKKRYPYGYSLEELLDKLVDFNLAELDPDPVCLKKKHWELIKLDIEDSLK